MAEFIRLSQIKQTQEQTERKTLSRLLFTIRLDLFYLFVFPRGTPIAIERDCPGGLSDGLRCKIADARWLSESGK